MNGWFSNEKIETVLARQEEQAIAKAGAARLERLRSNYEVVIDEIIRSVKPVLPSIAYSDISRSKPFEVQNTNRHREGEEAPRLVTGLKVYLPFTGDQKLFYVTSTTAKPQNHAFEPSIGQKDDFITVLIKEDELTSELVDMHLRNFHQDVERNLLELRRDIDAWIPALREKVSEAIVSRRQRLSAFTDLEAALTMPVRHFK